MFAELNGNIDDKTEYTLQVQNVTNDNYLKIHDIKEYTELIKNDSTLNSYLKINRDIDENTSLNTSIKMYEDLSKNDNDKYQFILPDFNFIKELELEDSYNGSFQFLSWFSKSLRNK